MKLINKNYNRQTIDKNEIWRTLGRENQEISSEIEKITDEMIELALKVARPKSVLITGSLKRTGESLTFEGIELKGDSIKNFLDGAQNAALLAVTLGIGIDREIKKLEHTDLTRALVLDACASVLIEDICDEVSNDFEALQNGAGKFTTERFSPGYGDLPLEIQPELLERLDAPRQLGLTTSDTCLLYPRKSVTAFIGILDQHRKPMGNRCENCILKGKCKFGLCKRDEYGLETTQ